MNLLRMQAHVTGNQMEALLAPYQAWLNSPFNPMTYWDGAKVKMEGFEALARMNPMLADFAEKFPNSIELLFHAANGSTEHDKGNRDNLKLSLSLTEPHKNWAALAEIFNLAAKEYPKPDYAINEAQVLGKTLDVKKSVLVDKPFADLMLFETKHKGPLLYIAPPLSGHYGTLIRDTIQSALNAGFRVAIYDTKNARDVPAEHGTFGLDDCVDYHREFISYLGEHIDPRVNVQAICQATVPIATAAATLAAEKSPYTPYTLDLDSGPLDPHAPMTEVTEFAQKYDIDWFKNNLISQVPGTYEGKGRDVYPGFRQLSAFIAMNPDSHANSFYQMFNHLVRGTENGDDYQKKLAFYDEYLSVCDLPAKFYLDTIERVFINNDLANGKMTWHGQPVDLSAYQGYLMTKEAALDDISAPGQTMSVHKLMPKAKGYHYRLEGAGHYGIFAGSKARDKALPAMFSFIHKALKESRHDYGPALDSHGNEITKLSYPPRFSAKVLRDTIKEQAQKWQDFTATRNNGENAVRPNISVTFPPLTLAA